jgi:hypothetical protein
MKIFTKAFWSDAIERVGSTFTEGLVAALIVVGGFSTLDDWAFWEPVLWLTVVALAKVLAAGFINPNTGGSLGTANPAGIVKALVTQKKVETILPSGNTTTAYVGATIAGEAATQPTATPVEVVTPGASPYSEPFEG